MQTPSLDTLQQFVAAGQPNGWKLKTKSKGNWKERPWQGTIAKQVLDAECWLKARTGPGLVIEFFPELSFMYMTRTVLLSKRTWNGDLERRKSLKANNINLTQLQVVRLCGRTLGAAGTNDVLDAAVGAWTAKRFAQMEARSWPRPLEDNRRGSTTGIWA